MFKLPIPILLLLASGCQKPAPFDYKTSTGVAVAKPDHTCLDISNASLQPGRRIQLIIDGTPQATAEAEVVAQSAQPCNPADKSNPEIHHYDIKVVRGTLPKSAPAFALLPPYPTGQSFHVCTSAEGVHLTIWSGKPLQSNRQWHHYYYLGYDVETNCTEAETKPE